MVGLVISSAFLCTTNSQKMLIQLGKGKQEINSFESQVLDKSVLYIVKVTIVDGYHYD